MFRNRVGRGGEEARLVGQAAEFLQVAAGLVHFLEPSGLPKRLHPALVDFAVSGVAEPARARNNTAPAVRMSAWRCRRTQRPARSKKDSRIGRHRLAGHVALHILRQFSAPA